MFKGYSNCSESLEAILEALVRSISQLKQPSIFSYNEKIVELVSVNVARPKVRLWSELPRHFRVVAVMQRISRHGVKEERAKAAVYQSRSVLIENHDQILEAVAIDIQWRGTNDVPTRHFFPRVIRIQRLAGESLKIGGQTAIGIQSVASQTATPDDHYERLAGVPPIGREGRRDGIVAGSPQMLRR